MKALVTGGSGFVGSHLIEKLVSLGHEVHTLVRKSSDLSYIDQSRCKIHFGDITDKDTLDEAFQAKDWVFHCAAMMSTNNSDKLRLFEINFEGTKNVTNQCIKHQVGKLIHVSSVVTVGGKDEPGPLLDERSTYSLEHLNSPNFESKRRGENYILNAVKSAGLNAVITNPSLIFGERDALKAIRGGSVKAAKGKMPFYTKGGVNIVSIEDVIEGLIGAAKFGRIGERYILAGENILTRDLFRQISQSANQRPPQYLMPKLLLKTLGTLGDLLKLKGQMSSVNANIATMYFWFDGKKAWDEFGICPKPSSYAIEKSVRWMGENHLI